MAVTLHLADSEATVALGRALASILSGMHAPPALLLQGELGSGKTTLVRGFVESLPGADMAEVSSPSFNICNLYPTEPRVAHFDLYRLEGMEPDDALFDCLEDPATITVVEWIQYLPRKYWPDEAIFLEWTPSDTGRSLVLHAMGGTAQQALTALRTRREPHQEEQ
ncbi:tRNA (adenosine(37)-N6)-threonylcarbamoyltransferase complex ATPase subunit type 1 TsaE [Pseudodesulfovibrio indicus]|uniref:tRNA (adenosine(37)-N6)-threonylcarbamoyltransferase complex ATPase subunit type 1 TsaE n=1 Tax=Pseudodesulfovibrio indicus TaxID=1716143 RepID=UPI00292F7EC2|nr:tRNA (adenosine(37)-N6)-threonylcarbamoyltransferase complex ATPase subunit type 1 TsaE [Pseudodesulfovibrio indicus]